jgi:hypothetical protein
MISSTCRLVYIGRSPFALAVEPAVPARLRPTTPLPDVEESEEPRAARARRVERSTPRERAEGAVAEGTRSKPAEERAASASERIEDEDWCCIVCYF